MRVRRIHSAANQLVHPLINGSPERSCCSDQVCKMQSLPVWRSLFVYTSILSPIESNQCQMHLRSRLYSRLRGSQYLWSGATDTPTRSLGQVFIEPAGERETQKRVASSISRFDGESPGASDSIGNWIHTSHLIASLSVCLIWSHLIESATNESSRRLERETQIWLTELVRIQLARKFERIWFVPFGEVRIGQAESSPYELGVRRSN